MEGEKDTPTLKVIGTGDLYLKEKGRKKANCSGHRREKEKKKKGKKLGLVCLKEEGRKKKSFASCKAQREKRDKKKKEPVLWSSRELRKEKKDISTPPYRRETEPHDWVQSGKKKREGKKPSTGLWLGKGGVGSLYLLV